jgi:hypothetical protein
MVGSTTGSTTWQMVTWQMADEEEGMIVPSGG